MTNTRAVDLLVVQELSYDVRNELLRALWRLTQREIFLDGDVKRN